MLNLKDGYDDYLDSLSMGNPALGLSDAIVGTYGPVTRPGQCDQETPPADPGRPGGHIGTVPIRQDPVNGVLIHLIMNPPAGCCCGGGTGFLIDESEMVL